MADIIKNFFKKKKTEAKFKVSYYLLVFICCKYNLLLTNEFYWGNVSVRV